MCSTSLMVPVRWCAGIASALSMLPGNVAAAAAVPRYCRKLRRSVVSMVSRLLEWVRRASAAMHDRGILNGRDCRGVTGAGQVGDVAEAIQ